MLIVTLFFLGLSIILSGVAASVWVVWPGDLTLLISFQGTLNGFTEPFFNIFNSKGKTVIGYGASTKGNIVLNYCGIEPLQLSAICDANSEKWGRITPGSHIPIISKAEMRKINPDYNQGVLTSHRFVLSFEKSVVHIKLISE